MARGYSINDRMRQTIKIQLEMFRKKHMMMGVIFDDNEKIRKAILFSKEELPGMKEKYGDRLGVF